MARIEREIERERSLVYLFIFDIIYVDYLPVSVIISSMIELNPNCGLYSHAVCVDQVRAHVCVCVCVCVCGAVSYTHLTLPTMPDV